MFASLTAVANGLGARLTCMGEAMITAHMTR
jgi:hypothetical protein